MEHVPAIDDVGGASDDAERDLYFDHREFAARATMEDEHYWHLARRELILETVRNVAQRDMRMLEIGCGAGSVATFLNEHGYQVDYGDVHRDALEVARTRAADRLGADVRDRRFVRMDVCRDEIPDRYEGILLLDVVEHLPDDVGALRSVHRALDRPNAPGFLVLTVPAFPMLWSRYDVVEHHKRRYTKASARAALEECSFEVLRATYFFFPLFFAAGAVKLVRTASNAVRPRAEPEMFTELVETRSGPTVKRAMMALLGSERRLLRRVNLPLGTSLLCVARVRTP
jgi:2-polyprenyl-3-methyl-5-hydroxy-6-metoxy-1,4-benzoquinol methylase